MKKLLAGLIVSTLTLSLFAGCGAKQDNGTIVGNVPAAQSGNEENKSSKIIVGASVTPHAEILEQTKEILKEQGYELEIREFTDYIQPNLTLEGKELDANYFQHQPYLEDFNEQNKTNLVSVAAVHYEPLGIYPGKTKSLDELQDGATIAVPNDTTNEARALLLLEAIGLIKINPEAGLKATINDITENPRNIKIKELESAQLARALPDVDFAVINGNNALQAGLNAATDALAKEEQDSLAAATFANILVVRKGDEGREDIKALIEALKSDKVKAFIEEKYQGAVVAIF